MKISLSCQEIEETRNILESRSFLNDNCIEIALNTLDNKRARKTYLLINQTGRQLPFTKKPDYINVKRVTESLRRYMQSKFCFSQKAIVLVYNRPKEYYPELDENLQDAARPHWFVLVIVFDSSFNFKIKVIDSFYKFNQNMKKNILTEAKLYITTLIQIFLELQGHKTRNIELNKECLQIIPSIRQEDNHSCGDFSIVAIVRMQYLFWNRYQPSSQRTNIGEMASLKGHVWVNLNPFIFTDFEYVLNKVFEANYHPWSYLRGGTFPDPA